MISLPLVDIICIVRNKTIISLQEKFVFDQIELKIRGR